MQNNIKSILNNIKYVQTQNTIINEISNLMSNEFVPTFRVNLDESPKDRWRTVIEIYKQKIIDTINSTTLNLSIGILPAEIQYFEHLKNINRAYSEEIEGISTIMGIHPARMASSQLNYEASAACKSIIYMHDKQINHLRVLEWGMTENLKEITINVEFMKNGNVIYYGTTWAGYIGILTGMRPNAFSVSINIKSGENGNFLNKAITMLDAGQLKGTNNPNPWPISFLVRYVLESRKTYCDAVNKFKNAGLIAPAYIIIAGLYRDTIQSHCDLKNLHNNNDDNQFEGCSIDRNSNFYSDPGKYTIKPLTSSDNCLYQGNSNTVSCMNHVLNKLPKSNNIDELWKYLGGFIGGITVYITLMISKLNYCKTKIK